ncbi:hypothetical protein CHS0354_001356 [Potamilus streckersoni]|uniref:Uncharacterized protein n=1 Tax=Potamilus streckersoni TaxID=2493646 RepID=A0AAE0TFJ1_9BIVA|nr:hypothetical protein CHS0354_001356 [Potamilus streckersoni]
MSLSGFVSQLPAKEPMRIWSFVSSDEIHKNENGGDEMEYEARHISRGPRNSRASTVFRINPEPFSGNEDWGENISQFEIYADLGNWKESEKVLALATCLRGPTKTFYISFNYGRKEILQSISSTIGTNIWQYKTSEQMVFTTGIP